MASGRKWKYLGGENEKAAERKHAFSVGTLENNEQIHVQNQMKNKEKQRETI